MNTDFNISRINKISVDDIKLQYRKLTIEDLKKLVSLQTRVVANLEDETYYYPLGKEDLISMLESDKRGEIYGFFNEDDLVATIILSYTTDSVYTLKSHLNISSDNVAVIDGVFVDIKYVGNGIQNKLIELIEENVIIPNKIEYVMAEVTVGNKYSLDNLLKRGFIIKGNYYKDNIIKRDILLKQY